MILFGRRNIINTFIKSQKCQVFYSEYSTVGSTSSITEFTSKRTTNNTKHHIISDLKANKNVSYNILKEHITQLINQRNIKQVWEIASILKQIKYPCSYDLYALLMKACSSTKDADLTHLCIRLYMESINLQNLQKIKKNLTKKGHENMAYHLLLSFQNCKDFTNLIPLRLIWENNISRFTTSPNLRILYQSAFIHTLLNTNQNQSAVDLFEAQLHDIINKGDSIFSLSKVFPIIRILDILASNKDCTKLLHILRTITEEQKNFNTNEIIITDRNLIKYLSTALSANDYELTKYIYDNYIMHGFKDAVLTTEDVLFEKSYKDNPFFNSISDTLIYQIMYVFVTKGDVSRTLSLIESHHIHKNFKGEKALNKDLCINIVEAYCYHPNLHENWDYSEYKLKDKSDESIKRVLDVLESFVVKLSKENDSLGYKDLSSSFSHKFLNYKSYDKLIEKDKIKREDISNRIINSEENEIKITVLPRKVSNYNLRSSESGNSLANIEVLTNFINEHIEYLKIKCYNIETITIFINCILNHVNLYQNFSATIRVLLTLNKLNPDFITHWLDANSFNIILNSLSNSNGGKICSLYLFKFLKFRSELTHNHYRCLISANIRGNIHHNLQYFIYNYLKDFNGEIFYPLYALLNDIPKHVIDGNEGTSILISLIKKLYDNPEYLNNTKVDKLWEENKLQKSPNFELEEPATEFNRRYNSMVDSRDSEYLKYILCL